MPDATHGFLRKSRRPAAAYPKLPLALPTLSLGHSCPQQCPPFPEPTEPLGTPLSIREAAALIGCSAWTIRQKYLPAGLPHHRLSPTGKLIFYRNQITRWLLRQQQKEGISV